MSIVQRMVAVTVVLLALTSCASGTNIGASPSSTPSAQLLELPTCATAKLELEKPLPTQQSPTSGTAIHTPAITAGSMQLCRYRPTLTDDVMVPEAPAALLKMLNQLKTVEQVYGPDAIFSCPVFHESWVDVVSIRATKGSKLTLIRADRGGCDFITIDKTAYVSSPAVETELDAIRAKPQTTTPQCSTPNLTLGFGDKVSEMTGEHGVIYTLTNHGKFTCHLYGHPDIRFYDNKGHALPFKYTWSGTQYVKNAAPHMVVLNVGDSAYFLVAKYRCDLGIAMESTTIRMYPPNTKSQLVGRSGTSSVSGFAYCKGGAKDPGQLVGVSPLAATPFSLF